MEEGLKLILEMGDNVGNSFYYWIAVQLFNDILGFLAFIALFYTAFRITRMIRLNSESENAMKEISQMVDEEYFGEITAYETKKVKDKVKYYVNYYKENT